jgi:hypothetical protein
LVCIGFIVLNFPSFSQEPVIQWQTCMAEYNGSEGRSIQQTPDSGYIVAGITGKSTGNQSARNFGVNKLSKTGAIEWQKSYGGNQDDNGRAIALSSDGGYIVVGETFSTPLNPPFNHDVTFNHGAKDGWVVKISVTGVKEWQKSYGGSSFDEFDDVIQTTDGGYIMIGYTTSHDGDVLNNINTNSSYWVVKINSTGTIEWQKAIGGRYGRSIQQTADGGYIVSGTAAATDSSVTGNNGAFDYWVAKLSNTGQLLWQKSIGSTETDNGYAIRETTNGGYIVTGGRTDPDGSYYMWTVKLNNTGNTIWQKKLSLGCGLGGR